MLPDFDRAGRIGEFWASPATRSFGELLIDLEEDRLARAVVVGMLHEKTTADAAPSSEDVTLVGCQLLGRLPFRRDGLP